MSCEFCSVLHEGVSVVSSQENQHDLCRKAVALVHDQLESFKYIGGFYQDKDNKWVESGEGLPVSIVTLPDFVLDFRDENVKSNLPVCTVGGHARASHAFSCILFPMKMPPTACIS